MTLQWHWLKKKFGDADGGAYSRLLDAHGPVHDLLAREVTQNSWDAARRLQRDAGGESQIPFRLLYEFRELTGPDRTALLSALQVSELVEVLKANGHSKLRLEAICIS